MGLALVSSGSVLEPAGISAIRHGGSFWQLLTEATSVAPHYQNLAMKTQHKLVKEGVKSDFNRSGIT